MRGQMAWVLGAMVWLWGCDQNVQWDQESPVADTQVQPGRVNVRLTPQGLGSLYTVLAAPGIDIARDEVLQTLEGRQIQVGPLAQKIPPRSLEVRPFGTGLQVTMRFEAPRFLVPVRVKQGSAVVICRWQIGAQQVEVQGQLRPEGVGLAVGGALDIKIRQPQVDTLGTTCPGLDSGRQTDPSSEPQAQITQVLTSYVQAALGESLTEFLAITPATALGLPTGELVAKPATLFDARQGEMSVLSRVSPQAALGFEGESVAFGVDAGVRLGPAACAPREELIPPSPGPGPGAPEAAQIQAQAADLGLSVGLEFLGRLLQGATRAGFLCRGLTPGEGAAPFPRRLLLLGEIGLVQEGMGEEAVVSVAPGALPQLGVDLRNDRLVVRFPSLQIEVYTTVLGARMRVAQVRTEVELLLSLAGGPRGKMRVQVRNVKTTGSTVTSEWQAEQRVPSPQALETWVRRLVLLALGEEFDVPLFFFGSRELELRSVTLGPDAMTLFLRL